MERKLERVRLSNIDLEDSTFCARLEFNDEEIQSLADSIENLGLRNPPGYVRKISAYQTMIPLNARAHL